MHWIILHWQDTRTYGFCAAWAAIATVIILGLIDGPIDSNKDRVER